MRYRLRLLTLAAGLAVWQAASAQQQGPVPVIPLNMENQGRIENLDLANRTVTVNGISYRLHEDFEVIRHTPDGPVALNPYRIDPSERYAVEARSGMVRRLHVVDPR